jgi:hypothetical protein
MAETLKELRGLSDNEVIAHHDRAAPNVSVTTGHYLQELARRDQDRQTRAMLRYTLWIAAMTGVVSVATIVNVVLAAAVLLRP